MLEIIVMGYFLIGFLYATYVLLFGGDLWYVFPINWFLWLPVLLYDLYLVLKKPKRII